MDYCLGWKDKDECFWKVGTNLVKEGGGVGSLLPKIALATIYSLNVIEINPELPRSIFDIFKQIIIFCNPSWEPENLAGLIILQI